MDEDDRITLIPGANDKRRIVVALMSKYSDAPKGVNPSFIPTRDDKRFIAARENVALETGNAEVAGIYELDPRTAEIFSQMVCTPRQLVSRGQRSKNLWDEEFMRGHIAENGIVYLDPHDKPMLAALERAQAAAQACDALMTSGKRVRFPYTHQFEKLDHAVAFLRPHVNPACPDMSVDAGDGGVLKNKLRMRALTQKEAEGESHYNYVFDERSRTLYYDESIQAVIQQAIELVTGRNAPASPAPPPRR